MEVCLAPGSRSAPLAMAFARHHGLRTRVLIDERSCSFFAVGLAKAGGRPVAILCTSGTAAVEFHAAVVEAFHSSTPLIVLTADRPPELVGVGANQAIDQARLYGTAVRWFHDPGTPADGPDLESSARALAARAAFEAARPPCGPVHVNLPFSAPLVPPPGQVVALATEPAPAGVYRSVGHTRPPALAHWFEGLERPLVVAGAHPEALLTGRVAQRLPVLAE